MFKKRNDLKKQHYERVYQLHQQAKFLCYINDAYMENYNGKEYKKLLGSVAIGKGGILDCYQLYDCNGRKKGAITMEEFYVGANKVDELNAGDEPVALYPKEQDVTYIAGDILVILND